MAMGKRLVVGADMQCGSRVGLTPPEWQYTKPDKYAKIREEIWDQYTSVIDALKPIDIYCHNGDAIEGSGWRQGSTDVLMTDRLEQLKLAAEAILYTEAKKIVLTRGTFYHVGSKENYEDQLAEKVNAIKISDEEFLDVNGLLFNVKHATSRSSVPHTKGTPLGRDRLWQILWSLKKQQPLCDIILRAHVHYFYYCGEVDWLGITQPALCGLGSKYGSRIPSETVDWGLIWFDVEDKNNWSWDRHIVLGETQKATPIKL
jgi:hypothetical protein